VKRAARELGIEVHQPRRIRGTGFRDWLHARNPDLLVVVAFGRILPRAVLESAPHGAINLHFSLLPAYRGAAPVQWALAHNEPVTGVTTMQLNEGMDEGDLLLQREVAVETDEHAPALQSRLSTAGARLLVETLAALEAGSLVPRPQDVEGVSYAPMLSAADGEVALEEMSATDIAGRVRGFDPWPGVWVRRAGRRLRLAEAVVLPGRTEAAPGRVLELVPEGLVIACGDGTQLALRRVQPEGRRLLEVRDAVNGRQIVPGDLLEPV
jgi:methionyl-tRNA formyltransferase